MTFSEFLEACFDYLDDERPDFPDPDLLSPKDRERAKRWIRSLVEMRRAMERSG